MGGTFREMTGAVFPGQGSEREGMMSLLNADFRKHMEKGISDNHSELNTQLNIYTVSASLWEDTKEDHNFSLLAGHSLGFYSALFAAGSIDFETGIYLISAAYRAISDVAGNNNYGMTAIIGIKYDIIDNLCKGYSDLYVANINSAAQVVVSGAVESLEDFENAIAGKALRVLRLPVTYPLHTPILKGVSDIMRDKTKHIELKQPGIPVMDHTSGEALRFPENLRETLIGQFSKKVVWKDVINRMWNHGVRRFVEIGPCDILSKLTRWIERDAEVINLDVQS